MTLLALIVDDETPARSELRHLLGGIDGVEVAGEAASAREALVLAERMAYDGELGRLRIASSPLFGTHVSVLVPVERPSVDQDAA